MKLSILIAAYNVEKFIKKCILSCASQNLEVTTYEIIVVNDGSTDGTLNLLENLKKEITNLVVINQNNSGLGAARNTALKHAKGEYVWFIDGDDYIAKNSLTEILSAIALNKLEVLVLNYEVVNDNGITLVTNANNIELNQLIITGAEFYEKNYSKSYSWTFVFKKSVFIDHKLWFKERINMQDSEIMPKLMIHIQRLSFLKSTCYYYVQQINSFTNTTSGEKRFKYFESIIEVKESLELFLENEAKNNLQIKNGLVGKIEGLHQIVFNHLLFFSYEKEWLLKIIQLLKQHNLYPLQHKAKGKMQMLKIGLNNYPIATKWLVDKIQSLRK